MKRAKADVVTARQPTSDDAEVGRRVRARRLELRLSQAELGEKVDVTFQQIQKYENGRNRIGVGRLQRIADALKVPVTFFFDGVKISSSLKSNAQATENVFALMQERGVIRIVKAFHRIKSQTARQTLLGLCEVFAEMKR